jgi:hypothetical protein
VFGPYFEILNFYVVAWYVRTVAPLVRWMFGWYAFVPLVLLEAYMRWVAIHWPIWPMERLHDVAYWMLERLQVWRDRPMVLLPVTRREWYEWRNRHF